MRRSKAPAIHNAHVWVQLKVRPALDLKEKLDQVRVKPFYAYDNVTNGFRRVGFFVPQDGTVQSALLLMAKLAPQGAEVFAS